MKRTWNVITVLTPARPSSSASVIFNPAKYTAIHLLIEFIRLLVDAAIACRLQLHRINPHQFILSVLRRCRTYTVFVGSVMSLHTQNCLLRAQNNKRGIILNSCIVFWIERIWSNIKCTTAAARIMHFYSLIACHANRSMRRHHAKSMYTQNI